MSTPTTTIAASAATNPSSATTSCVSAVPGKNGYVPPSACNALYSYNPSFVAAVIFTIIFGVITGVHLIQAISYRRVSSLLDRSDKMFMPADNVRSCMVEILLGHHYGCILGNMLLCPAHFRHKEPTKCCLCHRFTDSTTAGPALYVLVLATSNRKTDAILYRDQCL